MNRASIIYLSMIVALVGGLWAILAIGKHLDAPQDLAGRWQLTGPYDPARGTDLAIEQSGNFFELAFERGPSLSLKLRDATPAHVVLARAPWTVTLDGAGEDRTVRLEGPSAGTYVIHHAVHAYPAEITATEGK